MTSEEMEAFAEHLRAHAFADPMLGKLALTISCAALMLSAAKRHVGEAYKADNVTETITSLRELREAVIAVENT